MSNNVLGDVTSFFASWFWIFDFIFWSSSSSWWLRKWKVWLNRRNSSMSSYKASSPSSSALNRKQRAIIDAKESMKYSNRNRYRF